MSFVTRFPLEVVNDILLLSNGIYDLTTIHSKTLIDAIPGFEGIRASSISKPKPIDFPNSSYLSTL
jgi:hypothetical protein